MRYTIDELKKAITELKYQYRNGKHTGGSDNCPLCILVGLAKDEKNTPECKCKFCINSAFKPILAKTIYFTCVDRQTFEEGSEKYWDKVLKFLKGKTEDDIFNKEGLIQEKVKEELIKIDEAIFLKL